MKIAVVSSIFVPDLGYLEEGLTRVLTGMGHDVHVLTSFHYPVNYKGNSRIPLLENQKIALEKSGLTYTVHRLKTVVKFRSNIICSGLRKLIISINPDLVILIGVSDFFPLFLISENFSKLYKQYAFIGQNYDMNHWRNTNSVIKKIFSYIINKVVKGFIFRRSVRFLTKIVFYTPDTEEIIKKLVSQKLLPVLEKKKVTIPLGFNSDDFYFVPEARNLIRNQLNINSKQIVLITITRVEKSKRILEIINSLFVTNKFDIVYIIIGFIDNNYKNEIKTIINDNKLEERIICLPFVANNCLVNYLSAADLGIWLQSSVSIQQAMGTGLQVILFKNNTTSMLLQEGLNGYYTLSDIHKTIALALASYSYSTAKRSEIEEYNKTRFSYQSILKELLDINNP